jgi:hypothetical protein
VATSRLRPYVPRLGAACIVSLTLDLPDRAKAFLVSLMYFS